MALVGCTENGTLDIHSPYMLVEVGIGKYDAHIDGLRLSLRLIALLRLLLRVTLVRLLWLLDE